MKIAIFTDAFPPQVNGVVTHILETVNILRQNHDIYVFAPQSEKKIRIPNLPSKHITYLPSAPFNLYKHLRITLPLYPHLTVKLARLKPDVIHFHTPSTVGANGIIIGKILRIPIVGTFHTYFMEPEYLRILGLDKFYIDRIRLINRTLWGYARLYYNNADLVISPSLYTKKDLFKHGIKKPIEVISNGISTQLNTVKSTGLKKFSLPKKYFLYVGRISKEKNIDTLIKSFLLFAHKNTAVDLVVVGSGPALAKLKNIALQEKIKNRIFFLGEISNNQLIGSNIYRNALAFVTASTSEIQPMSILEALKFGLPIVAVRARGISELVKKNGLLAPPYGTEKLAELFSIIVNNEKQRLEFGRESLKLADMHSIEKTVSHLEKIYTTLSKEKKSNDETAW